MDMLSLVDDIAEELGPQIKPPAPMVPGLTLHVDGDYLAYYASGNEDCTQGQARLNALNLIASSQAASGAEKVVVHNTANGANKGERYVVATVKPYQGQRDPGRKPKNYYYMRDWLLGYSGDRFVSKTWVNREADDGIGACALHALTTPAGYAVIFTRDKDLRMLPGLHVEWLSRDTVMVPASAYEVKKTWRDGKEMTYGLKWFWLQMLQGDAADHIPGLEHYACLNSRGELGLKKMGEKTAEKFLAATSNTDEAYGIVRGLYREYYTARKDNWADRFVEQAALLWMRTDTNAKVGDFARHKGPSCISKAFCGETWAAVERLENRVRDARTAVDALAS